MMIRFVRCFSRCGSSADRTRARLGTHLWPAGGKKLCTYSALGEKGPYSNSMWSTVEEWNTVLYNQELLTLSYNNCNVYMTTASRGL